MDTMATLPDVILGWTRLASSLGPHYPTGEFITEAFCSTCVADVSGPFRHSPMPRELHIPLCRVFEVCFHCHLDAEVDRTGREGVNVMKEIAKHVDSNIDDRAL